MLNTLTYGAAALMRSGSISCPSAFTPKMRWFVSYVRRAAVVTEK